MATEPVGWAPGSPWFAEGFKHIQTVNLDDVEIRLLPLGYFLATKFSAFYDRGGIDPRTSHDFEDITYILDNQMELVDILSIAQGRVLDYLKAEFTTILSSPRMKEAILVNLYPTTQSERLNLIMDKLKAIIN